MYVYVCNQIYEITLGLLTASDLGTFPRVFTFWLCFWLAILIRCLPPAISRSLAHSGPVEIQKRKPGNKVVIRVPVKIAHNTTSPFRRDSHIGKQRVYTYREDKYSTKPPKQCSPFFTLDKLRTKSRSIDHRLAEGQRWCFNR